MSLPPFDRTDPIAPITETHHSLRTTNQQSHNPSTHTAHVAKDPHMSAQAQHTTLPQLKTSARPKPSLVHTPMQAAAVLLPALCCCKHASVHLSQPNCHRLLHLTTAAAVLQPGNTRVSRTGLFTRQSFLNPGVMLAGSPKPWHPTEAGPGLTSCAAWVQPDMCQHLGFTRCQWPSRQSGRSPPRQPGSTGTA